MGRVAQPPGGSPRGRDSAKLCQAAARKREGPDGKNEGARASDRRSGQVTWERSQAAHAKMRRKCWERRPRRRNEHDSLARRGRCCSVMTVRGEGVPALAAATGLPQGSPALSPAPSLPADTFSLKLRWTCFPGENSLVPTESDGVSALLTCVQCAPCLDL